MGFGVRPWDHRREVTLHQFAFPFSGERWNSFSVGTTGSIAFRAGESMETANSDESKDGGVSIGTFDPLSEAASDYQWPGPAIWRDISAGTIEDGRSRSLRRQPGSQSQINLGRGRSYAVRVRVVPD